jgi:hypothetical protein
MAKRSNEPTFGSDKAKVRVFYTEVEGNNESVQEALKTMVAAMSRPVRIITEQKSNGEAALLADRANVDVVDEVIDQAESLDAVGEEPAPSNERKPRGAGKKVDRNAGINLVPDLDFMPKGKQSLKEFLGAKAPKNDVEFVLATVYFMQHEMGLSKIGPGHVKTALKEAGISIPVDLKQTIRNVKNTKIWLNFSDIEDVRTTTQGENYVEHEMGKSE